MHTVWNSKFSNLEQQNFFCATPGKYPTSPHRLLQGRGGQGEGGGGEAHFRSLMRIMRLSSSRLYSVGSTVCVPVRPRRTGLLANCHLYLTIYI